MSFGLIWDWVKFLSSPASRHLRAMGYAQAMRRLGSRGLRCRTAWQPHVLRGRSLILEAAARCPRHRKALVLGSGPLFDIPVTQLSWRFNEVVLVDIVHSWRVRSLVNRFRNVRLECADVTGIVKDVHSRARSGYGLDVPERRLDLFLNDGFDLVVSANILSQLALLPVRYITRLKNGSTSRQVEQFSRRLIVDHLNWLASFDGVVCLITDLERLYCDSDGTVCREGSLWGVHLPEGGQEWIWDLAPRPEIDRNYDVRHRVLGYAEFPKRTWLNRRDALARL